MMLAWASQAGMLLWSADCLAMSYSREAFATQAPSTCMAVRQLPPLVDPQDNTLWACKLRSKCCALHKHCLNQNEHDVDEHSLPASQPEVPPSAGCGMVQQAVAPRQCF